MSAKAALLAGLALAALAFCGYWWRTLRRAQPAAPIAPAAPDLAIGFGTNFLDTLGIGSFAPTTALFRLLGRVPDARIPGTLNVGHTLPSVAQALIFIAIVAVEMTTLVTMIAAAIAGAFLGARVVADLPLRPLRLGLAIALLVAAGLFAATNLGALPGGGTALGLDGPRLALAIAGNAVLGALMTLGIGLYAPCMILVATLGMNPIAAFPIMMGSCAFLMPVAGARFVARGAYAPRAALGLALGGIPGVLIAAWVVRSLPLQALRWLVVAVVLWTAAGLLRSALRPAAVAPATCP